MDYGQLAVVFRRVWPLPLERPQIHKKDVEEFEDAWELLDYAQAAPRQRPVPRLRAIHGDSGSGRGLLPVAPSLFGSRRRPGASSIRRLGRPREPRRRTSDRPHRRGEVRIVALLDLRHRLAERVRELGAKPPVRVVIRARRGGFRHPRTRRQEPIEV